MFVNTSYRARTAQQISEKHTPTDTAQPGRASDGAVSMLRGSVHTVIEVNSGVSSALAPRR